MRMKKKLELIFMYTVLSIALAEFNPRRRRTECEERCQNSRITALAKFVIGHFSEHSPMDVTMLMHSFDSKDDLGHVEPRDG